MEEMQQYFCTLRWLYKLFITLPNPLLPLSVSWLNFDLLSDVGYCQGTIKELLINNQQSNSFGYNWPKSDTMRTKCEIINM